MPKCSLWTKCHRTRCKRCNCWLQGAYYQNIKRRLQRWSECMTKQHAVIQQQKRHLGTEDAGNLGITWPIYSESWEASPVTPKCHRLRSQRLISFKRRLSRVRGLPHGDDGFSVGTRHPLKTASLLPAPRRSPGPHSPPVPRHPQVSLFL